MQVCYTSWQPGWSCTASAGNWQSACCPGCIWDGSEEAVLFLIKKCDFHICEKSRHLFNCCIKDIEVRPDEHIFSRYIWTDGSLRECNEEFSKQPHLSHDRFLISINLSTFQRFRWHSFPMSSLWHFANISLVNSSSAVLTVTGETLRTCQNSWQTIRSNI